MTVKKHPIIWMIIKSVVFTIIIVGLTLLFHFYLKTGNYLSDVGGISSFASIFGTVYGIAIALVLLEVWGQFNKTSTLIEKEATGLEKLYRLSIYFRDKPLAEKMKTSIRRYVDLIVKDQFKSLAIGEREKENSRAFREISNVIKNIKFDDDHDSVIFNQIIRDYGDLSQIRTERISQSLTRLPIPLKIFLYSSSLLTLFVFMLMPFANIYYGILINAVLAFIISVIFQLINDLDNPFEGFWIIGTDPYKRMWKHIEEDY